MDPTLINSNKRSSLHLWEPNRSTIWRMKWPSTQNRITYDQLPTTTTTSINDSFDSTQSHFNLRNHRQLIVGNGFDHQHGNYWNHTHQPFTTIFSKVTSIFGSTTIPLSPSKKPLKKENRRQSVVWDMVYEPSANTDLIQGPSTPGRKSQQA